MDKYPGFQKGEKSVLGDYRSIYCFCFRAKKEKTLMILIKEWDIGTYKRKWWSHRAYMGSLRINLVEFQVCAMALPSSWHPWHHNFYRSLVENVEIRQVDDCTFGFLVVETLLQGSLLVCPIRHCYWYFGWESLEDLCRWHRTRRNSKLFEKPYQYSKIIPSWNSRLQYKGKI